MDIFPSNEIVTSIPVICYLKENKISNKKTKKQQKNSTWDIQLWWWPSSHLNSSKINCHLAFATTKPLHFPKKCGNISSSGSARISPCCILTYWIHYGHILQILPKYFALKINRNLIKEHKKSTQMLRH